MEPQFPGERNCRRRPIGVNVPRLFERSPMSRRAGILVLGVALLLPAAAFAYTSYGQQTMSRWKSTDRCAEAAQRAFPDYTAESNAKRDAAIKNCLASGNLPPRAPDGPAKP
jgi:hypothetical protein